jgi:tetratricopeptide (TPR) repeat protein
MLNQHRTFLSFYRSGYRMVLIWAILLFSIAVCTSCHRQANPATLAFQKSIDSLNTEYGKPGNIRVKNLPAVLKIISSCDSMDYHKGYVDASINAYKTYFQASNYLDALKMLENARKKLHGNNSPVLEARVEFYMGLYHSNIKNYDIAYKCFINAVNIYKRTNDTMRLANAYTELGTMYIRTQNWPLAKKYLWLAYVTNSMMKVNPRLANDLDRLGIYFQRTGNNDSAEIFYEKAYKINEKLRDSKILAQNLVNFGGFYVDIGKYSRAEELLLRALRLHPVHSPFYFHKPWRA